MPKRVIDVTSLGVHSNTRSRTVKLVDVTAEAVQAQKNAKKERDEKNDTWEERRKNEQAEREQEHQRRDLSENFIHDLAIPIFATALEVIKSEALLIALVEATMTDSEGLTTDEAGAPITDDKLRRHNLRCCLMSEALKETADKGWGEVLRQGPVAVAKHLQAVAADWGVSLPEDWIERAKSFEVPPAEPEPESEDESSEDETQEDGDADE
jgi:hypothetical protein